MSNELRGYVEGCTKYKLIDKEGFINKYFSNKYLYYTFIEKDVLHINDNLFEIDGEIFQGNNPAPIVQHNEWQYFQPILDEDEAPKEENNITKDNTIPTEDEFVKVLDWLQGYISNNDNGDDYVSFISDDICVSCNNAIGGFDTTSKILYQRITTHNQKRSQRDLEKLHNDITELEKQLTEAKKQLELATNKQEK